MGVNSNGSNGSKGGVDVAVVVGELEEDGVEEEDGEAGEAEEEEADGGAGEEEDAGEAGEAGSRRDVGWQSTVERLVLRPGGCRVDK